MFPEAATRSHKLMMPQMYLLWMIIYTPMALCPYFNGETSFVEFCLIYIRNLIFFGEQYNSWPLWYLLSTIYSLIIIILLIKLKITPRGLLVISILFAFISFGTNYLISTTMEMPAFLQLIKRGIQISVVNGRIFGGMIYIPLGMLIAHNKIKLPTNILMFIAGFVARCYFESPMVNSILLVLTIIGFFGIVEQVKLADSWIYMILRNSSTVIYLIHMYVWSLYYFVVYKEKTYGMDSFLFTSIVSLMLSFFYIHIRNKQNRKITDKISETMKKSL